MKITEFLKENILVLDGGMGTLLQARGLAPGELPERWNLTHPQAIQEIHAAYFAAGSHVVATNTFGASCLKLGGAKCPCRGRRCALPLGGVGRRPHGADAPSLRRSGF